MYLPIVFTENRRVRCTHTLIIGQRISEKGGFQPAICWHPSSTPTVVKATAAAAAANENVGLSINRTLGAPRRQQIVYIYTHIYYDYKFNNNCYIMNQSWRRRVVPAVKCQTHTGVRSGGFIANQIYSLEHKTVIFSSVYQTEPI